MIPNSLTTVTTQGDLGGEKSDFGIDQASIAHILSVLSGLYSDNEEAVIREYSTNALDAHVEVGNTAPIEVTTPTAWTPYFIVQDYGPGLSKDQLTRIYAMYGASTKRDSNEQVGAFGLGSKSALAYTNTFTIDSVKDGVRTLALVARKGDGIPEMEILVEESTAAPNGVRIEVPVLERNSFRDKCYSFFQFWKPGTVLVDGEQPKSVDAEELEPGIFWYKNSSNSYVVMGNVAYRVKRDDVQWGRREQNYIVHIPIGSVDLTPSREELTYTPNTQQKVEEVTRRFKDALQKKVQDEVAQVTSPAEALKVYRKWSSIVSHATITYQGKPIPQIENLKPDESMLSYSSSRYRNMVHTEGSFDPYRVLDSVFISGYKAQSVSSPHKQRIRAWLTSNGYAVGTTVFLSEKRPVSEWFLPQEEISWDLVPKLPKSSSPLYGSRKTIAGSWEQWTGNYSDKVKEITSLDTTKPIVFVSGADPINNRDNSHVEAVRPLLEYNPDIQFLRLGSNRQPKFLRDFPNAKHIRDYLREEVKNKKIPKKEKMRRELHSDAVKVLTSIDSKKINDPELAEWVEIAKMPKPNSNSLRRLCSLYNVVFDDGVRPGSINPFDSKRYPLARSLCSSYQNSFDGEHLAVYLNAAYAIDLKAAV